MSVLSVPGHCSLQVVFLVVNNVYFSKTFEVESSLVFLLFICIQHVQTSIQKHTQESIISIYSEFKFGNTIFPFNQRDILAHLQTGLKDNGLDQGHLLKWTELLILTKQSCSKKQQTEMLVTCQRMVICYYLGWSRSILQFRQI